MEQCCIAASILPRLDSRTAARACLSRCRVRSGSTNQLGNLDQHLQPRPSTATRGAPTSHSFWQSNIEPEPMQLGFSCLSAEERRCRGDKGLCLYCGGMGHYLDKCPLCQPKSELTSAPSLTHNQFFVSVQLFVYNSSVFLFVLVDSGSSDNFILSMLVNSMSIPVMRLASSFSVRALDDRPVSNSLVTDITQLLQLTVQPSHSENI